MSNSAGVFEINAIDNAGQELSRFNTELIEVCDRGLKEARELSEQTEAEENTSRIMLEAAKLEEAAKLMIVLKLEGELAAAYAELASTASNPVAAIAVEAKIADLQVRLLEAKEEHWQAVNHREAMEHRYELASKANVLAKDRCDFLQAQFEECKRNADKLVRTGCARIGLASEDLQRYISRMAPDVRSGVDKWLSDKPQENKPVRPDEVRDKLNVDDNITDAVLEYLYATDAGFRASVDGYCVQLKAGDKAGAELKIKKQMTGRLCEEIVIRAFKPMSTEIKTQSRESLPDGRYTKVDMIVEGLTNPLILGRGEGMGATVGGSLAVEVKSGHSAYLYQQMSHMCDQAIGHRKCDASCVVCTRDIHDLPPEKENELRERLRKAGSPIIGMLPRKDDLDARCINFVRGKMKDV